MKLVFDAIVFVENIAAVVATHTLLWLHDRYHWITPRDIVSHAMMTALIASFSGVILGCLSLIIFRMMKRQFSEDFSNRRIWAQVSFAVSAALMFICFFPVEVG